MSRSVFGDVTHIQYNFYAPVALFVKLSRPRGCHLLLDALVSAEVLAGVEIAEEIHRNDLRSTTTTSAADGITLQQKSNNVSSIDSTEAEKATIIRNN